jgi:hypothetical protein
LNQTDQTDRAALLEALTPAPPEVVAVEAPGLAQRVFLRMMTGAERDAYDAFMLRASRHTDATEAEHERGQLLVRTLCDASGGLLYDPGDPAHAAGIGRLSQDTLGALCDEAQRLNGLGGEAADDASGHS